MRYYKVETDGLIQVVGIGQGGKEITKIEYDRIIALVGNCSDAPKGFSYRLKDDLTWELVELPPEDMDPDVSDSEALAIILGGGV